MNKLQYKMKAKSRYQPSKTVEALFTTALVKIKADAEKVVAEQKATLDMEVVSAKDGVEAKGKESVLEQKVEPKTESFDQTSASEMKPETEAVSRKEAAEKFENEDEPQTRTGEQKAGDTDTAFEDVAEEKVQPEVETEAASQASAINPETESYEQKDTSETKSVAEPVSGKETTETFGGDSEQEAETAEQEIEDADAAFEDVAEEKVEIMAESREPDEGDVSKSIRQIAQSQSNQPRKKSPAGFSLCAKDVMLKKIVWGSPEDSVQQAITKMQQYNSRYLMVGIDGVLVGIVSNSSVAGALSPYLRPVFAKWRRPLDDATLQIRIKWIMSRPVHIVKPQTPLANIIGNMCRYGVLCLPVVDHKGKVLGLVTESDIFKTLLGLKSSTGISASDNEQREQYTSDHRGIESTPTMEPDLLAPV